MVFLTINDLKTKSFEQYINESKGDFEQAIDLIELQNIELMKSKLSGRYNTTAIFEAEAEERNLLIIQTLSVLVIYDLLKRNKARKFGESFEANYKAAIDWLNDVRDNKEHPDLPPKLDSEGNPVTFLRYGNNSNENYYL